MIRTGRPRPDYLTFPARTSSVTGLLLAGVGHVTEPPDSQRNFLVVDNKTENSTIAKAFDTFTKDRKDIGIVLINQHVSLAFCLSNLKINPPCPDKIHTEM